MFTGRVVALIGATLGCLCERCVSVASLAWKSRDLSVVWSHLMDSIVGYLLVVSLRCCMDVQLQIICCRRLPFLWDASAWHHRWR